MLSRLDILVVEDDKTAAELFREMLQWANVGHVDVAKTATDALQKMNYVHYDAMLLDLILPNGDGTELIKKFQTEHPEVPIIVVTGMDQKDIDKEAIGMGAQEFLSKGAFTDKELVLAIRHAVSRHKVRRMYEPIKKDLEKADDLATQMIKLAPQ